LLTLNFVPETFFIETIPMPLLLLITVIIGLAMTLMVHFLHMSIMWLRNWPDTRTITSEHFLNRIFCGIIGALLGLLLFMFCGMLKDLF
jgi:hypothetical protein